MTREDEFLRDIDEILAHTTEADFAGQGNFQSLTPAERLEWLDETSRFVLEFKGLAGRRPAPG
jgi:hypothetical protein